MTELKRFDIEYTGHAYSEYRDMVEEPDGEYVLFTDYEAKCADYERLREALEKLQEGLLFGATNEERLQIVREALCPTLAAISSSSNSVEGKKE